MKEYPLISIVIPAKNEEENIYQCLKSLNRLDYPAERLEIIVVDNGSLDNTVNIAQKMGVKVSVLPNVTIAALRNYGFEMSSGEYIAFLDSDCTPSPNWLKEAMKIMDEISDVLVVGSALSLDKNETRFWIEEYWNEYLYSKHTSTLQIVETLPSFCFLVRKEVFKEVGGFNSKLFTCEDSDFGYRISEKGKIVINCNIRVIHRGNAKSPREFFKRQLWHGGANILNLFSHDFRLRELPSIVIPFLYLVVLLFFPLTFFVANLNFYRFIMILFLICTPISITLKTKVGRNRRKFLGYCYIWFIYLLSRALGMIIKGKSRKVTK